MTNLHHVGSHEKSAAWCHSIFTLRASVNRYISNLRYRYSHWTFYVINTSSQTLIMKSRGSINLSECVSEPRNIEIYFWNTSASPNNLYTKYNQDDQMQLNTFFVFRWMRDISKCVVYERMQFGKRFITDIWIAHNFTVDECITVTLW